MGAVNREIKATSIDMNITLIGIDPANISLVLGSNIKGSTVEIWRGFFDSNYQIITSPSTQFFKRYQGIVSNISITEDWSDQARSRTATAAISCASFRSILENRIAGIKTNLTTWQQRYASDTSMSRVAAISGQYFDFGALPASGSQSDPNTVGNGQTSLSEIDQSGSGA